MLNIFYQNSTLKDTLIINIKDIPATNIVKKGDIVSGFFNNEIVFINILNASNYIPNLKSGLIFFDDSLNDKLNKLLEINLSTCFTNGFKIGMIEECQDIPNTHLHKCVVDIKDKKLNIVCGAANARKGLKVVVATEGTMLPDGKQIIPGELLGNKSEGMLCSYRELQIDKPSNGIIELDDSYNVGDYFKEAYVNCR